MHVRVETRRREVAIAQVESGAFGECRLAAETQQLPEARQDPVFLRQQAALRMGVAAETLQGRDFHPVEDGGTAVGRFRGTLTDLLPEIKEEGSGVEKQGDGQGREAPAAFAAEEGGGEALLIVVLQEVQHAGLQVPEGLPVPGDGGGGMLRCGPPGFSLGADQVAQDIIQARLVIERVETGPAHPFLVVFLLVNFRNE